VLEKRSVLLGDEPSGQLSGVAPAQDAANLEGDMPVRMEIDESQFLESTEGAEEGGRVEFPRATDFLGGATGVKIPEETQETGAFGEGLLLLAREGFVAGVTAFGAHDEIRHRDPQELRDRLESLEREGGSSAEEPFDRRFGEPERSPEFGVGNAAFLQEVAEGREEVLPKNRAHRMGS